MDLVRQMQRSYARAQDDTPDTLKSLPASLLSKCLASEHTFVKTAGAHSFFFSSRRRHTRSLCDWSSDVCSSDLVATGAVITGVEGVLAQHNVLTRDVLLVLATAVVVADDTGIGRRPLGPVDPAVFEGNLLRRRSEERRVGKEWSRRVWRCQ